MPGRPAYDRDSYLEDILIERRRGLTWDQVAAELGISRATVFRILNAAGVRP